MAVIKNLRIFVWRNENGMSYLQWTSKMKAKDAKERKAELKAQGFWVNFQDMKGRPYEVA